MDACGATVADMLLPGQVGDAGQPQAGAVIIGVVGQAAEGGIRAQCKVGVAPGGEQVVPTPGPEARPHGVVADICVVGAVIGRKSHAPRRHGAGRVGKCEAYGVGDAHPLRIVDGAKGHGVLVLPILRAVECLSALHVDIVQVVGYDSVPLFGGGAGVVAAPVADPGVEVVGHAFVGEPGIG